MTLSTLYESANKKMYDTLVALKGVQTGAQIDEDMVNNLLGGMLNRVGDTIVLQRASALKYPHFQKPVSEYGAVTEYIGTKLVKPMDMLEPTQGSVIEEFIVNNPDYKVGYVSDRVKATFLVTTTDQRWKDAVDGGNIGRLAQLTAMAVQSLYDSVTEHMNGIVPIAFGAFWEKVPAQCKVQIPKIAGSTRENYLIDIISLLRANIRKLGYTSSKYNLMGADINSRPEDLVLIVFDTPLSTASNYSGYTSYDLITSQIKYSPISRASGLQESLGIADIYEMEALGMGTGSVARQYASTGLIGQQIANMSNNVMTEAYPYVRFALVSKDALNVGAKSIRTKTTSSARADLDFHYTHIDLEVGFGTGNIIFFHEEIPTPPAG